MSILDFFKPAPTRSVKEVRALLDSRSPEEYLLLDVRQAKEYARGHLPGAKWIPVDELEERIDELDSSRQSLVYCSSSARSRAAATILTQAGFSDVAILHGGIREWEGLLAEGLPEPDLGRFYAARTFEEHLCLAWLLEEGTRRFYEGLAEQVCSREAVSLFRELAGAEVRHQDMLLALYEGLAGRPAEGDFPTAICPQPEGQRMEGGMLVQEALDWTRGRQVRDILELAIGLEATAYDRYLILRQGLENEHSRRIFEVLSDEERRHLQKLTQLLDHFI